MISTGAGLAAGAGLVAAGGHDHGKVAKDAPEGGKGFATAHKLAAEANQNVFAPLREIMESNEADVVERLEAQLALVDTHLQAPSTGHPLWHLV